jgi:hypothetical protein
MILKSIFKWLFRKKEDEYVKIPDKVVASANLNLIQDHLKWLESLQITEAIEVFKLWKQNNIEELTKMKNELLKVLNQEKESK